MQIQLVLFFLSCFLLLMSGSPISAYSNKPAVSELEIQTLNMDRCTDFYDYSNEIVAICNFVNYDAFERSNLTVQLPKGDYTPFVVDNEQELNQYVNYDCKIKDNHQSVCMQRLQAIDFKTQTLLGIQIRPDSCRKHYELTYKVLKNTKLKQYLFSVQYRDSFGRCAAFVLDDYPSLWVLVPKLPDGYKIIFEVEFADRFFAK